MKSPHTASPRRPNLPALAGSGEVLSGVVSLRELPRLAQDHLGDATSVHWRASVEPDRRLGSAVDARGFRQPDLWLHLHANTTVRLVCQRCLQPMDVPLVIDRRLLFVDSEARAAALDEELEEDVLSLERPVDLIELVEDELVLAMPIVPLHDDCRPPGSDAPAARSGPAEPTAPQRPHPFAVLAQLKGRPKRV